MKFILRPILSEIKELYLKPISNERFKEYLSILQGETKGDLKLPISGFNPMAKEHVLSKLLELESLDAEGIITNVIEEVNSVIAGSTTNNEEIVVVLNLADDLKGSWTNFYSTDFDSKFKIDAFIKRNFCVPYFWTSEKYNEKIIQRRTQEYLYRTCYQLRNQSPITLEDHLTQEVYAAIHSSDTKLKTPSSNFENIERFYRENKNSEDYDLIFNFFYGDIGSENLGYKTHSIKDMTGFDYAKFKSIG